MRKHYTTFFTCLILLSNTLIIKAQTYFAENAADFSVDDYCGIIYLGGGISFNDFNNDGWDDITIATQQGDNIKIYENQQDGSFTLATELIPENSQQHKQVVWVDYDNDSDKDLLITSDTGINRLYRNDNGTLIDVTIIAGLPLTSLSTYGASWGDYDNDGYLDLFLSNRGEFMFSPNRLYKNNGNGTFTNVSDQAGINYSSDLSFCAAFLDYDNDGWQDIYVSNDKPDNANTLYKNNGDGTFTDVSEVSGTDITIDAMTVTVEDFNYDGWLDIYVTNDANGNVLLKNNGDGTFTDIAESTNTIFYSLSWGAIFFDADLDADLDLYVSGSLDGSNPNYLSAAYFENQGVTSGTFTIPENAGFIGDNGESYSNALGDVNNDGLPEIVVSNSNYEDIFLWENQTTTNNNWLKIKLEGTTSNRQGVGSRIELGANYQTQYRYTLCGEGYLGQNSDYEFFGVADATNIDYIKVTWLSGIVDVLYDVSPNQVLEIKEGDNQLNIEEEEYVQINIYPNPVKDVLNIKARSNIQLITIHNIIGQEVYRSTHNATDLELNMSQLTTGSYFVKVSTDSASETIRVLKQ
ncbi:FG-GAP-like repeat-containing protein [Winogradskyella sp. 3972H.M.0a.05]|uniref:FG-GAP-like repeat-containing protein n=1 Tax=Winogradskyella sp. 3972H.M.0a.05 TaxID=2950277 RepID=UPI0033998644